MLRRDDGRVDEYGLELLKRKGVFPWSLAYSLESLSSWKTWPDRKYFVNTLSGSNEMISEEDWAFGRTVFNYWEMDSLVSYMVSWVAAAAASVWLYFFKKISLLGFVSKIGLFYSWRSHVFIFGLLFKSLWWYLPIDIFDSELKKTFFPLSTTFLTRFFFTLQFPSYAWSAFLYTSRIKIEYVPNKLLYILLEGVHLSLQWCLRKLNRFLSKNLRKFSEFFSCLAAQHC